MFNFKVANVLKSVLFLVLFLIFFKLNLLSKFNILIFLVIIIWDLVCVMLYLCLYTYIQHDSENWFLMYSIRHNKDLFKKISVILMRINLYCNPFIVLISAIEVLFYKQFKKLNYWILKHNINIKKDNKIILFIILKIVCCFEVIRGLFYLYYRRRYNKLMYCILIPYPYKTSVIEGALNFIKERYIIGMESIMLLSVVVLLSFLKPYVLITDVIIIYIILEVLLIFVNIAMYKYLVFLNNTEDVVFVDSSIESPLKQLKVKVEWFVFYFFDVWCCFKSPHNIIKIYKVRDDMSFLCLLIGYINCHIAVEKEKEAESSFSNVVKVSSSSSLYYWGKGDYWNEAVAFGFACETYKIIVSGDSYILFYKLRYLKNRVSLKYFKYVSCYGSFLDFNFEYEYLMYKYYKNYSLFFLALENKYSYDKDSYDYYFRYCFCDTLLNEISNYPSYFLYNYIIKILFVCNYNVIALDDTMCKSEWYNFSFYLRENLSYEYFVNELKGRREHYESRIDVEDVLLTIEYMVKFDKERIKLLFYMIWDIEACLNIENYNYDNWWYTTNINLEFYNQYYDDYIFNKKYYEGKSLQQKVWLKKQNAFYDLDQNFNFFKQLFKYYPMLNLNYNKEKSQGNIQEICSDSGLLDTNLYISEELELYYEKRLYLVSECAKVGLVSECAKANMVRSVLYEKDEDYKSYVPLRSYVSQEMNIHMRSIRSAWEQSNQQSVKEVYENLECVYKEYKKNVKV